MGKNLKNVIHEALHNIAHEKILVNVMWTKSLYGNFQFSQISPTLH